MNLRDSLQTQELALLHEDWRSRAAELERLLAPDFIEVAGNGRVTSREQVLAWLLAKDPAARWACDQWQLHDYGAELCLLRYHARQVAPVPSAGQGAWHASLWGVDTALGYWRLRYHQASKIL